MSRSKQSVQRELLQQYKNFNMTEEKVALYSELEAPLHLLNQREQLKDKIDILESYLESGNLLDEKSLLETNFNYVNNVPPLPPHYVDRETDLGMLREVLLAPNQRPVVSSLRGMGGIGKTTLAIALCHDQQVIDAFPDGILWATLGPQSDIFSAQISWATALNEDLTGLPNSEARASRLRTLLTDKKCLLVIDDVWDTTDLRHLQVGGVHCATLVTTRERKIAQKVGGTHNLDILEPKQAITLLEKWAGEIEENERALAGELAQRLGYLPLALALAGAQAQDGETWNNLLAVFRDNQGIDISLLDLDDPTIRDESLNLAFDLSIERLDQSLPEQFIALGVFAAGREAPFTAEAASMVWELHLLKAKKILDRLVRAALLDKEGDYYHLHLLLRDYAYSRLDDSARTGSIFRHNNYYLKIAQSSKQEWKVAEIALPQINIAWRRIAEEDVESLYTWALATCKAGGFFYLRGKLDEKAIWVERTKIAAQAKDNQKILAWCEYELGNVNNTLHHLDEALEHYLNSLSIYSNEDFSDRKLEANVLHRIGLIHRKRDEYDKAFKDFQQSQTICYEINYPIGEAYAINSIGELHYRNGDLQKAMLSYKKSLSIYQENGVNDPRGEATWLRNTGHIHRDQNEFDQALKLYQASLNLYDVVGDRRGKAYLLNSIGSVYDKLGELDLALDYFYNSLTVSQGINDERGVALALRYVGLVYEKMMRWSEANQVLTKSLNIFEGIGSSHAESIREVLLRIQDEISNI